MARHSRRRDDREAQDEGPRINKRIRAFEVRVIDPDGGQLGVMRLEAALDSAQEFGLDLVEVAPNARPPVCKIMDYGKYKYQMSKKAQNSKSARVELKEIKMRPKTDEHDFQTKLRKARGFLEKSNKVKFTVRFRGREITHPEIARAMLVRAAEILDPVSSIESSPRLEGRAMTMTLSGTGPAPEEEEGAETSES
jgi:translation initiation factor IF-3